MNKQTFIVRSEEVRANLMREVAAMQIVTPQEVTIKPYRKKRSLSQNAYLHMILGIIADETGNSIEDVKEAYRDMFLGKVAVSLGGEERIVGRSTTKLNTQEMNDLLDKIRAHAATELGINLPLPEDRFYEAA